MKITQILPQKNDPNRANILIDGKFALGLSLKVIVDEGLKVGRELTEDELLSLKRSAAAADAKKKGVLLLSRRPHSKKELIKKLSHGENTEKGARQAADELEKGGYLDDLAFAKSLTRHLLQKKWGKKRIESELIKRGVDRGLISQAIAEEYDADEKELIRQLLEKRFPGIESDKAQNRRAANFLLRYGFESADIFSVLREDDYE